MTLSLSHLYKRRQALSKTFSYQFNLNPSRTRIMIIPNQLGQPPIENSYDYKELKISSNHIRSLDAINSINLRICSPYKAS